MENNEEKIKTIEKEIEAKQEEINRIKGVVYIGRCYEYKMGFEGVEDVLGYFKCSKFKCAEEEKKRGDQSDMDLENRLGGLSIYPYDYVNSYLIDKEFFVPDWQMDDSYQEITEEEFWANWDRIINEVKGGGKE